MLIVVNFILAGVILFGLFHEEALIAWENSFCRAVRQRLDRGRAETLRRHGWHVTEIPEDCTEVVTVRVRE